MDLSDQPNLSDRDLQNYYGGCFVLTPGGSLGLVEVLSRSLVKVVTLNGVREYTNPATVRKFLNTELYTSLPSLGWRDGTAADAVYIRRSVRYGYCRGLSLSHLAVNSTVDLPLGATDVRAAQPTSFLDAANWIVVLRLLQEDTSRSILEGIQALRDGRTSVALHSEWGMSRTSTWEDDEGFVLYMNSIAVASGNGTELRAPPSVVKALGSLEGFTNGISVNTY